MKKFFATTAVFILFFSIFLLIQPSDFANGESGDYDILYPPLKNYLYLDDPILSAVNGDKIAVYDKGLSLVFIAGSEQKEHIVDFLKEGEVIIQLLFFDNNVLALTNRARLYNFSQKTFISLPEDITDISVDADKMYYYYGTSTIYDSLNNRYTDTEKLIISSDDFTVNNGVGYFLKDNKIYTLTLGENEKSRLLIHVPAPVDTILCADNKLFLFSSDNFYGYSITGELIYSGNCNENFPQILNLNRAETDGNNFIFINHDEKAVYTYSAIDFSLVDMFGCASNNTGWYNNPSNIAYLSADSFAIWDRLNSRIQVVKNMDTVPNAFYVSYSDSFAFDRFTADGNYAVFDKFGKLYLTSLINPSENANFVELPTAYNIGAMVLSNQTLYIHDLSTQSIYFADITSDNPSFNLFCYLPLNVKRIEIRGNDNPVLYALTDNGIYSYVNCGRNSNLSLEGAIAFDIDYFGNILALMKEGDVFKINIYDRLLSGYEFNQSISLKNLSFSVVNLIDIKLNYKSDAKYCTLIDSSKNVLIKATVPYSSQSDYSLPSIPLPNSANPSAVSFCKSKGTAVYRADNNFNILTDTSSTGETLIVLEEFSTDEMLMVITENGHYGFVPKKNTVTASAEVCEGTVIALHDSVRVYNIPSIANSKYIEFDKSQVLHLINDCAKLNNGEDWYKISYSAGGDTYYGYVIKTRVMSYNVVPEIEKPIFAKAKSSRLGAKVKVYAMADDKSAVVTEITDGEKVKLLCDFDENSKFTYIEFSDITGYMLTSELQINKGLTNGQIVAIVLASATVVITALYLLLNKRNKKLSRK